MLSLSLNSLQTDPNNPPSPFSTVATALINKAVLTKAMWFLAILDVLLISGLGLAVYLGVDLAYLWKTGDLRVGIWIWGILHVLLVLFFAIAEVVINFIHARGLK
ncbi:hypothetical protein BJH92_22465 [Paenibacillus polymyxa]|nr:hypothetical protein BJH92_22465 [Paenibacillus polymyxa]